MEVVDGQQVGGDGPRVSAAGPIRIQLAVGDLLGNINSGGAGELQWQPAGQAMRNMATKTF